MKRYTREQRGIMGVAILAVLGVFLAIHLAAPGVSLWPALLVTLVMATMIASHLQKGRHRTHRVASQTIDAE